jgi:hypothetical protein
MGLINTAAAVHAAAGGTVDLVAEDTCRVSTAVAYGPALPTDTYTAVTLHGTGAIIKPAAGSVTAGSTDRLRGSVTRRLTLPHPFRAEPPAACSVPSSGSTITLHKSNSANLRSPKPRPIARMLADFYVETLRPKAISRLHDNRRGGALRR